MAVQDLFGQSLKAVNVGLENFAESLRHQGVDVVHVDWHPPLEGYMAITHTRDGVDIDAANAEAVARIRGGRPLLVGMGVARDVIPGWGERMILHAGPPITWERMCGPQRGAVMGAVVYEGWANDYEQAAAMAAAGEFTFEPCHHHHAVGPMAGIVSPSMPVFIVQNETFGNLAYSTQNEGLGRVLRYGAYGDDVLVRLKWMETTLYPALKTALKATGPIDLRSILAQALQMGDEGHNRNRAATSLLIRQLAPVLIETATKKVAADVLKFIDGNDHFFLNLSMAALKAMLEPAEGIRGSTIVTVMARNGTDFGIRVAGMPDRWFTAPAPVVQGLWLPGFAAKDANPDIGDSAITETGGAGGFAMAAAPAIVRFVGGTSALALQVTQEMYQITAGEHEFFTVPALDFRGTPLGIDVRKVMQTGILPFINTGIAHKEPGVGMVGAGLVRAPRQCFEEAFKQIANMDPAVGPKSM
ncbi:MAG TPA: DUF1116 domain-containing protein [Anaerolineae bacterium]|nr:DUF1116 domain-containing protein [Anaerolineae bacterium]HQH38070.1 DUF1116 domain-containing protein [Anaerolineae bacterium]